MPSTTVAVRASRASDTVDTMVTIHPQYGDGSVLSGAMVKQAFADGQAVVAGATVSNSEVKHAPACIDNPKNDLSMLSKLFI